MTTAELFNADMDRVYLHLDRIIHTLEEKGGDFAAAWAENRFDALTPGWFQQ